MGMTAYRLTLLLLAAVAAVGCAPAPGGTAPSSAPSASSAGAASPSTPSGSAASPSPPTPAASPALFSVKAAGEAGRPIDVTVLDRSGEIRSVRSATDTELRAHDDVLSDAPAAVVRLGGTAALVIWRGTACDTTATLDVAPGWASMDLRQGPHPSCDLAGNPRGVVIETGSAVPSDGPPVSVVGG